MKGAIQFGGSARGVYGLRIDFRETLQLVGDESQPLVKRVAYRYHARLPGYGKRDGNVVRYEGPDLNPHSQAPPHHRKHHRHIYDRDGEDEVEIMEEWQTPTLPEFVRGMVFWTVRNLDLVPLDERTFEGVVLR
jgi:hypothetical protein